MSALPMITAEPQRRLTVFKQVTDKQGRFLDVSWEQLPAFLMSARAAEKKLLPAFTTAILPDANRAAGAAPLSYDYVIGDYDAKEVSIEDAVARLNAANIRALVHTSTSWTPEAPTWHVLCPVASTRPDAYPGLVERLNSILNGILQPESIKPTQLWFYGSAGNPVEVTVTEGTRDLDAATEILGAPLKPKRVAEEVATYEPQLQASSTVVEFYSQALEFLPSTDYLDWVSRSYAMASFKGTPFEAQAHAAWCRWTKASPKFQERDLQMWATLHDAKNKPGVILKVASENGWTGSALAAVLESVQSAPLPLNWQQWVPLLTESEQDTMLVALQQRTGLTKTGLNKELRAVNAKLSRARSEANMVTASNGRLRFTHNPHNYTTEVDETIARTVAEAHPGAIVQLKGRLAHIRQGVADIHADTAVKAPPAWLLMPHTKPTVRRLLSAHATWWRSEDGCSYPTHIPDCILDDVTACASTVIPEIVGISNWPFVTSRGRFVQTFGLDAATRVFMTCPNTNYVAYDQDEAQRAYNRLANGPLLGEFRFAAPKDRAGAVSLLFTQLLRRILPTCPTACVVAAQASSGKTTLVQTIATAITGQRVPITLYPTKEEERAKTLYALALYGPAAVLLDNVPDGSKVVSDSLAAFATSDSAMNRTLGISEMGRSAPTNFMVYLTGNRLELGSDLLSRVQVINLNANTSRPSEIVYTASDPIANAIKLRAETLRDVCGILGWWATQDVGPTACRFKQWDEQVRQPILKLSGFDIADGFSENLLADEDTTTQTNFLDELYKWRGLGLWKCSDLVAALDGVNHATGSLAQAATAITGPNALPADTRVSTKAVGKTLKGLTGVWFRSTEVGDIRLTFGRRRVEGVQGDYYSIELLSENR